MPLSAVAHYQRLILAPLGSGSRGNCTYIGNEHRGILVDCGISTKQIFSRLDTLGLGNVAIEAVFITHEHSDHVGAARILSRKIASSGRTLPFYATPGTWESLNPSLHPDSRNAASPGKGILIGNLWVEAIPIPHDTLAPVAYAVTCGTARVGVITDLGKSTRTIEHLLSTLDMAVVEFNHDVQMLLDGSYPWALKQRIRGHHGHLSNEQAYALVAKGASSRLQHLFLGHLSEENNHPDLAYAAAERALYEAGCSKTMIHIAEPIVPTKQELGIENTIVGEQLGLFSSPLNA